MEEVAMVAVVAMATAAEVMVLPMEEVAVAMAMEAVVMVLPMEEAVATATVLLKKSALNMK